MNVKEDWENYDWEINKSIDDKEYYALPEVAKKISLGKTYNFYLGLDDLLGFVDLVDLVDLVVFTYPPP